MANLLLVIIFMVIILIVLILLGAFIYTGKQVKLSNFYQSDISINQLFEPPSFLSSCLDRSCPDPYVCDARSYICKYPLGHICNQASDCGTTGAPVPICSGICVSGPTGSFGNYCPCDDGLECTLTDNNTTVCLYPGGTPCKSSDQCASNFCNNFVCATGLRNGNKCRKNNDCFSNNCSRNICQPNGVTTGFAGAFCSDLVKCASGNKCYRYPYDQTEGVCYNDPPSNINQICSCSSICGEQLVCSKSAKHFPIRLVNPFDCQSNTELFNFTCQFLPNEIYHLTAPPPIYQITQCIGGMRQTADFKCLNNSNVICSSGSQCFSGNCSGTTVLNLYKFSSGFVGPLFFTANSASLELNFPYPEQITISKCWGWSKEFIDYIYIVSSKGLLRARIDTKTQTLLGWDQLMEASFNGNKLIDCAFYNNNQGNQFLYFLFNNEIYNYNYIDPSVVVPVEQIIAGLVRVSGVFTGTINIDVSPANPISAGKDIVYTVLTNTITIYELMFIGTDANDFNDNLYRNMGFSQKGNNPAFPNGTLLQQLNPNDLNYAPFYYYDIQENYPGTIPTVPPQCPRVPETRAPTLCKSQYNLAYSYTDKGLIFSGNLALPIIALPESGTKVYSYSIYSPSDGILYGTTGELGMRGSNITMITDQGVIVSVRGNTTYLPVQCDVLETKPINTANGIYLISSKSCK